MIKSILRTIKWLLVIYVLLMVAAYFFQEKLIFHPEKLPQEHQYSLAGNFEEVNLTAEDGEVINALHLKIANPKGIILYFHGNSGSLALWGNFVSYFLEYDYNVLVMDYRGFGKSTGIFDESKMFKDAQLCYEYLTDIYTENKIIVYGKSLGTTFATKVASENNPQQLILEVPFYNLAAAARHRYPFAPVSLLKFKFETNKFIKKVKCPITIFHGTEDWITPYDGGKKLFEEVVVENKQFITIENGGHNNLTQYDLYKEKLKTLLN